MRMMKLALATGLALRHRPAARPMPSPSRSGSRRPACPPRFGRSSAASAPSRLASRGRRVRGDQRGRRDFPHAHAQGRRQDQGEADRHRGRLAYTYEIVEGPLPVKNYKSKLWVEADDEPDRTVIYWQSDFDRQRRERRRGQEDHHRHSRRRRQGHQEDRDRRLGQEASRGSRRRRRRRRRQGLASTRRAASNGRAFTPSDCAHFVSAVAGDAWLAAALSPSCPDSAPDLNRGPLASVSRSTSSITAIGAASP